MYKLSVNGGLVDFLGEPKIIIMTNDPGEYSFGQAHKTYYIDIVNNANNHSLIGESVSVPSILFLGEIQISGILYIESYDEHLTKGMFVSGVGEVWDSLRGVKLKDLDWSEHDHELTYAGVIVSESADFIRYDMIYRGTQIAQREEGYSAISDYDVTERYPSFRIKEILEKIFEGYEVVYDLDDYFVSPNYLYLLYTQDYEIRNTQDWVDSTEEVLPQVFAADDTQTVAGTAGNFSVDVDLIEFNYNPTETGTHRLRYTLPMQLQGIALSDATPVNNFIVINSTLTAEVTSSVRGKLISRDIAYNVDKREPEDVIDIDIDTRYFELDDDEDITINVKWSGTWSITSPPATPSFRAILTSPTTSELKIQASRWYGVGSTVEVAELMPDIEALEFVRELCVWLNMRIYYRPTTKQIILSQNFSDTIIDWTDRMLLNKGYEVNIGETKRFTYKMSEDDTFYNKQGIEYTYGDEGDIQEIKLFVHPVNYGTSVVSSSQLFIYKREDITITTEAGTEIWGNEYSTKAGLRIAYNGDVVSPTRYVRYFLLGGTLTTLPYFRVTRAVSTGWNVWSPSLYMETFKPFGSVAVQAGLFDKHHRETIQSVAQSRILTCTLLLNNADILNLINIVDGKDWRVKYHLLGVNYRLLELEQLEGNIYKGRFLQIF